MGHMFHNFLQWCSVLNRLLYAVNHLGLSTKATWTEIALCIILHKVSSNHQQGIREIRKRRFYIIQDGVRGSDVFHIAAGGDWLEWGKQTMCAQTQLGMQFSHGELDGESLTTSSENKQTVQMQDDSGHLIAWSGSIPLPPCSLDLTVPNIFSAKYLMPKLNATCSHSTNKWRPVLHKEVE